MLPPTTLPGKKLIVCLSLSVLLITLDACNIHLSQSTVDTVMALALGFYAGDWLSLKEHMKVKAIEVSPPPTSPPQ